MNYLRLMKKSAMNTELNRNMGLNLLLRGEVNYWFVFQFDLFWSRI
jgi:hypothetical protein